MSMAEEGAGTGLPQPVPLIFVSHATADDGFVAQLRQELEALRLPVWVDSRNLRGGDKLHAEIANAIAAARQVLVVLSPSTVNSPWVRWEIRAALAAAKGRGDGYRVIPLLLPGITAGALGTWFEEEPVAVPVPIGPGGLSAALPALLTALGERSPTDPTPAPSAAPAVQPVEDLVLTLTDPAIKTEDGKRRATATAELSYQPADHGRRRVDSLRFTFTAPLGPIEAEDLRWYLESYFLWPIGLFAARAQEIEKKLPQWGHDLFAAGVGAATAHSALDAWQQAGDHADRRFSVLVDSDLPEGATEEARSAAREAGTDLLALPWELLHDGRGWLFQGACPVRVRRRLPNRAAQPTRPTTLPIRILLLSPRPEQDDKGRPIAYIDHRISARPLVEALEGLGDLARLTVLTPPTYAALDAALLAARGRGEPFDVVHFDGHGVYDRRLGLGGLCFEDAHDATKPAGRAMEFVDAARLAGLLRGHRVPLVVLEACQTAVAEQDPTASVAARLLQEGVASVVAMSHSVLVETARRFVEAFYKELASGVRVGQAMLAGQRALFGDTWRGKVMGAGELRLADWFVPVLFQEEPDPQLVTQVPAEEVQQLAARKRRLNLGALPAPPAHRFAGRSRELLALERRLHGEAWAVVRGTGGAGKTTLAVELARWLTRTGRCERAAFVSLEAYQDARGVLDTVGRQLLAEGEKYSVAQFADLNAALQPVERALCDHPTIVVVDNCESVLPDAVAGASAGAAGGAVAPATGAGAGSTPEILALCRRLLDAHPATRLVFTSRESLPAPFAAGAAEFELGALDRSDAIELVSSVLAGAGLVPSPADAGGTPQEITDLVAAVNGHARARVLLAPEVARAGVKATTADVHRVMADLERRHPGDRENSLYASVELSLRRLGPASRERVRGLAVCSGGVNLAILGMMTSLERQEVRGLAAELIGVGLGEDMGYGHLHLDPGLPPYLLGQLSPADVEAARERWAEAMAQLTGFLYEQRFKDAKISARLTRLELPNLLGMLEWLAPRQPAEMVVELAGRVESLVANLGCPQVLAQATRVRERAAAALGEWSHARFLTEGSGIERLLERGDPAAATTAARALVHRCVAAGDSAYAGADYDTAMAHAFLGRALKRTGGAEEALPVIGEAQRRFQRLGDAGGTDAQGMVSVCITEGGSCLLNLGRMEEAASAYEEGIRRAAAQGDRRGVAVGKTQLGRVRLGQRRHSEAIEAYVESRDTFEALGEPRSVATAWHQIGMVYHELEQFDRAEDAYRHSLAIDVREQDLGGQAATLNQLASLYGQMQREEEAITFLRQACDISVRLGHLASEGLVRNNLAGSLVRQRRYDDARQELHRAIKCQAAFGMTAQSWKTWALLQHVDRATGHPEAAAEARLQANAAYLAYRRAGGVSQSPRAKLYELVVLSIRANDTAGLRGLLSQLAAQPDAPPSFKALVAKLQAILAGGRGPALAADPGLDYDDAAELQLLLESLASG